ncbi:MAG: hypothetical protein CMF11_08005 [Idiomarina sp.]|nr:hypothetical protein [Idiomarina sp.]
MKTNFWMMIQQAGLLLFAHRSLMKNGWWVWVLTRKLMRLIECHTALVFAGGYALIPTPGRVI